MRPRPEAPLAPEIDDVTLARAQRGDGAAFEQMVRRYQGLVWSYLWRMVGAAASRPLIEDLFQETFLGVHRGLARFAPAGPARLSTWILSIATRVALYRRRTAVRDQPMAAGPDLERGDGGDEAQGIERRLMRGALLEALAALSPEHRAIVVLREFHELDYDEIAVALELQVGTVRSRLTVRARACASRSKRQTRPHEVTDDTDEDPLEEALRAYEVPPPAPDLAERVARQILGRCDGAGRGPPIAARGTGAPRSARGPSRPVAMLAAATAVAAPSVLFLRSGGRRLRAGASAPTARETLLLGGRATLVAEAGSCRALVARDGGRGAGRADPRRRLLPGRRRPAHGRDPPGDRARAGNLFSRGGDRHEARIDRP